MSKRAVDDYFEKGWSPFPLPRGQKSPPPPNVTGRWHNPSEEELRELWESEGYDGNLGLKLKTVAGEEYDIMGVDIDTYDDKDGWATYQKIAEQIGPLPLDKAPFSTRRGVEANSGQYFFRVKKGTHLNGKLGDDIDIIQPGHRYTAAFPSVVGGLEYKWYLNGEETDIPRLEDIPLFPEEYIALAVNKRGKRSASRAHIATTGSTANRYRGALDWMREGLWGFDVPWDETLKQEDYLSPQIAEMTDLDLLLDRYRANSHDSMNADVYRVIAFGTEGHKGVKAGLHRILQAFQEVNEERMDGTRRTEEVLNEEYQRSVYEAVNTIAGEIEAGSRFLMGDPAAYLIRPDLIERARSRQVYVRPKTIEAKEVNDDDYSHAAELHNYWRDDLLYLSTGGHKPFAMWQEGVARYNRLRGDQMFNFVNAALSDRFDETAKEILDKSEIIAAAMEQEQLPEGTPEPEVLEAQAKALKERSSKIRNTTTMRNILAQVASISTASIEVQDLDSHPNLLGVAGGTTLDLTKYSEQEEFLRDSKKSDLLTMNTAVSLGEPVTSKAWESWLERHLPDPALRRFVQQVMGYALEKGNPRKILPILWGPSNTGKTVMLEACTRALGDYGGSSEAGPLFRAKDGPSPEIVNILDKRMVAVSEVGTDQKLEGSTLKKITGNDKVTARALYSNETISQSPSFTPFIATNTVPRIVNADDATRQRLLVLPFNVSHKPVDTIKPEDDLLNDPHNQKAILWWMIEGYRMWRIERLEEKYWPEGILELRDDFMAETSEIHSFVAESFEIGEDLLFPADQAWSQWQKWTAEQNVSRANMGTRSQFESQMKSNGFSKFRTEFPGTQGKTWCFQGIGAKSLET